LKVDACTGIPVHYFAINVRYFDISMKTVRSNRNVCPLPIPETCKKQHANDFLQNLVSNVLNDLETDKKQVACAQNRIKG